MIDIIRNPGQPLIDKVIGSLIHGRLTNDNISENQIYNFAYVRNISITENITSINEVFKVPDDYFYLMYGVYAYFPASGNIEIDPKFELFEIWRNREKQNLPIQFSLITSPAYQQPVRNIRRLYNLFAPSSLFRIRISEIKPDYIDKINLFIVGFRIPKEARYNV